MKHQLLFTLALALLSGCAYLPTEFQPAPTMQERFRESEKRTRAYMKEREEVHKKLPKNLWNPENPAVEDEILVRIED